MFNLVLPLVIAVAIIILIYFTLVLPTQWLKVERVDHPVGINKKILHISDMHVERIRVSPERIRKLIQRQNPDMIALTGDFMDRNESFPKLERYLAVIRDSGKPCFAVLGNHDYHLTNSYVKWLLRLMREYRIQVLQNQSVLWEGANVVGIDDFCTYRDDEKKAYATVNPKAPVLILTHDPNIVLHLTHSYDYLLSGHLHGKQFNIPLLYHFQPMGPLPLMGIYKGLHQSQQGTYYISKGLGQSGLNARFLIRSEVTVHQL